MPKKLLVGLGSLILVSLLLEFGFRALESPLAVDQQKLAHMRAFVCDGDLGWYSPHPYTAYIKPINTFGFNDLEWKWERTPGVPRVLCTGGSTTEGGNSLGRLGAFPFFLENELEQRCGHDFEVYNAGMSSWTSAEELVAWFLLLQELQPDLLVIHSGINDCEPRAWPGFWPDYRHYRRPLCTPCFSPERRFLTRWSDLFAWIQASRTIPDITTLTRTPLDGPTEFFRTGKLDPATARSFRRNIEAIGDSARARGARVLLMTVPLRPADGESAQHEGHFIAGVAEHNEILRDLARTKGWMLADAARMDELDRARRDALFVTLAHVTPEGNQMKAGFIVESLAQDWPPELGSCSGR